MKELACVLVLSLVSLVTATPYGYGVKGGAAAKADASAGAGTFGGIGGIPHTIPSGGSYSGSFSKSSSSSFASSSASASSSSFAFSGSGGTQGVDVNAAPGSTKCTTGNCASGSYGSTGPQGSGSSSHSGSHAAAAAGAGALTFPGSYGGYNTPCTSGNCSGSKPPCKGSNCDNDSDKKCTSSGCSNAPSDLPTGFGGNDIYVPGSSSKTTNNDNKKPSISSGSDCAFEKCGGASDSKTSPTVSSGSYSSSTINKPSTSLTTPKEEAPCSGPNCGSPSTGVYDSNKPSSYNVPINGDSSYSQSKPSCISGNCKLNPSLPSGASNIPTLNTGSPIKSPADSHGDVPDFIPLGPTGSPSPSSVTTKYPNPSDSEPTNSPYVSAGISVGANTVSNAVGGSKTTAFVSSTKKEFPYTGGFGGPPGILKPNEFTAPSKLPSSNYKPTTLEPVTPSCTSGNCGPQPGSDYKPTSLSTTFNVPVSSKPVPCTTGNCASQSSNSPSHYGQSGSSLHTGPTGTYNPTGPSGSYNPTGCTSGNCGSQSAQTSPSSYKPTGPAVTGTYKPPTDTGSPYQPTGCSTGNCGPLPNKIPSVSAPSGSYFPIGSSGPSYNVACTSGNCGSQPTPSSPGSYNPTGVTNSGYYHPSGSAGSSPSCLSGNCGTQPSTGSYQPTGPSIPSSNPGGCSSGNCGSQFPQGSYTPPTGSATSGYNKPAGSFGNPKHDYAPSGSEPNRPFVSSGCSSGKCGSSEFSNPQIPPTGSSPVGPSASSSYNPQKPVNSYQPSECASGNCGSKPSSPGTFGPSSTGCSSGNCGAVPSQPTTSYGQADSSKPSGPGCVSGNCGAVPSQPTSIYGQNDSYKPSTSPACSSGKCGTQPGQSSSSSYQPIGPSGSYNPSFTSPSGSYKPVECTSGNCGSHPSQSTIHQGPVASAIKPAGPSGPYNPSICTSGICGSGQPAPQIGQNDFQYKPGSSPSSDNIDSKPGFSQTPCSAGSCGGSSATAAQYNPLVPTQSFGGPSGFLKPNEFGTPAVAPVSNYKPISTTGQGGLASTGSITGPTPCTAGKCGTQPGQILSQHGQTGSGGSAVASANAVAYTGGFGGPPGLLKPYDDGKLIIPPNFGGNSLPGSSVGTPNSGIHSTYGKSLNGVGDGSFGGSGAQATAAAGASAGAIGNSHLHSGDTKNPSSGCKGGCGSNASFGYNNAKSASNAVSNANAGAYSGSFASSSASAHASAGAATKGGYGKR